MVKVSVNRYITRRIDIIREEVEATTQRLRNKTIENLEEIFNAAAKIAGGGNKTPKNKRKNGQNNAQTKKKVASRRRLRRKNHKNGRLKP